ncbi:MAG TPA: nuclear transport factor 2 family protein [Vicinamibacterales bacterium]|nr:nuclear transport factor 2 family protein [Vicinamibacterales bacterium]
MTHHDNVTLVREFYAARERGDRDRIRGILSEDVAWHDPYPPPHGGDLNGRDAVFRDVFDAAGQMTGGTTRLWIENVMATGRHAAAVIGWSSTFRGRTMTGQELAVFHIESGRIVEAWFYPDDPEAVLAFFG